MVFGNDQKFAKHRACLNEYSTQTFESISLIRTAGGNFSQVISSKMFWPLNAVQKYQGLMKHIFSALSLKQNETALGFICLSTFRTITMPFWRSKWVGFELGLSTLH
jgi:hypothetical protein